MMDPLDVYNAFRWVNILLGIAGLTLSLFRAAEMWEQAHLPQRFRFLALSFFCVGVVFGTVSLIIDGVPGGPRTVVQTIPLVWLIIAGSMPERKGS